MVLSMEELLGPHQHPPWALEHSRLTLLTVSCQPLLYNFIALGSVISLKTKQTLATKRSCCQPTAQSLLQNKLNSRKNMGGWTEEG